MNMPELGLSLKARRKALKLSQAQLASTHKMSRATISNLENGKLPELGVRKLIALCGSLGLELSLREIATRPTLRELAPDRSK